MVNGFDNIFNLFFNFRKSLVCWASDKKWNAQHASHIVAHYQGDNFWLVKELV